MKITVHPGEELTVRMRSGSTLSGRVETVDESVLVLRRSGHGREMHYVRVDDVESVTVHP